MYIFLNEIEFNLQLMGSQQF